MVSILMVSITCAPWIRVATLQSRQIGSPELLIPSLDPMLSGTLHGHQYSRFDTMVAFEQGMASSRFFRVWQDHVHRKTASKRENIVVLHLPLTLQRLRYVKDLTVYIENGGRHA
jgi:hypothetical protein